MPWGRLLDFQAEAPTKRETTVHKITTRGFFFQIEMLVSNIAEQNVGLSGLTVYFYRQTIAFLQ